MIIELISCSLVHTIIDFSFRFEKKVNSAFGNRSERVKEMSKHFDLAWTFLKSLIGGFLVSSSLLAALPSATNFDEDLRARFARCGLIVFSSSQARKQKGPVESVCTDFFGVRQDYGIHSGGAARAATWLAIIS